ncbi:MAG TPA: Gfo/Idh/MocA family oxidoreductase [Candidatus Hydrogenedentes bacterium]|jgi:predicted dehydrogenase|nr:MAG: Inositol 2-dehydrogenase [Candidatus Hydrogenedentes bacterium ADurb.Bin170]HNZ47805.1 Gfo/Idh/MocA family oxidoreductase [Candidatus Hydrogenedentota bacterium]HOD95780.1 Gfo/Idh/MocA family oxidoreductase [Candidatus Hydrogenedentota bacterium]HOH41786.1 Gfo/Idh/MocA family oxidoreductase [Candidatus Hydrogenedentota bacterium]HOM48096.1 Gfo/Idh/MocA family oxidoreductase [Candidatus Hydrogenedentota bacterium]
MADVKKTAGEKNGNGAINRRSFIKTAGAGALIGLAAKQAHASVYKSILPATVLGANERLLTGHIGIGGMGRANLGFALQRDDIQPIAICDIYKKNLFRASQMLKQKYPDFQQYKDFRELLDNKDVDAVVIATSDHWHCLCTLHAADAGKHIYCEKPLSTTIAEGHAMVDAVKRNKVVFQGGNMQRSGTHFQEAVKLIQEGYIGDVAHVETWSHDQDKVESIGMGETDLAKYESDDFGIDWDFHQGWVEHRPFNTNRWIYNFRWFLEYSGGKITDWGAHLIDIVLWAMGEEKQPRSISSQGGKYIVQDNRTTPDTLEVAWRFDDYVLTFKNRVWNPQLLDGSYSDHGIVFYGTKGMLEVSRGGYEVKSFPANGGCEPVKAGPSDLNQPHWTNWIECIKSGGLPISNIDVLHNTTRVCHIGTCSYVAGTYFNSGAAFENGELPDEAPAYGGSHLEWDDATQRFTKGDPRAVEIANAWAYREYKNGWSLKAPYHS